MDAINVNIRLNQERSAIIRQITPPGRKFGEQARLLLEAAIDEQGKLLARSKNVPDTFSDGTPRYLENGPDRR